jgi:3-phosphoglycerate kinase
LARKQQCCWKIKSWRSVIIENLRFHSAEEAGDVACKELLLGDIYVNAFGTAHRAHLKRRTKTQCYQ